MVQLVSTCLIGLHGYAFYQMRGFVSLIHNGKGRKVFEFIHGHLSKGKVEGTMKGIEGRVVKWQCCAVREGAQR